jgi:hypothetical protein
MKTTNYNNSTWGRYKYVHKLGRVGYAELGNRKMRVIFYIK